MDTSPNYFWLITISENTVNVTLVSTVPTITTINTSREIAWGDDGQDIITAVDNAIASCGQLSSLPTDQEPDRAAFIISPFWVASDGKIIDTKINLIKSICKQLSLNPMGFMPYDEAIVEEANKIEGIPASFVLAYIDNGQLIVSLTYLGKIKRRLRKLFSGRFKPELLESSIIEMNVESALPPLINLCGLVDDNLGQEVRNYPWVGKKNTETFLHIPEVKIITKDELIRLYARIIARQINPDLPIASLPQPPPEFIPEPVVELDTTPESSLADFGFSEVPPPPVDAVPETEAEPELFPPDHSPVSDSSNSIPEPVTAFQPLAKVIKSFPAKPSVNVKISNFNVPLLLYCGLGLFILVSLVLQIISRANIDLAITPYAFNQNAKITATTQSTTISGFTIPVSRKEITVSVTASTPATGKKTIGDNAKGEIIVFNSLDKIEKIPKGTALISDKNLKFTLDNDVQVTPATSDLDKGVITLGQTKVMVTSADIGPEYNLDKDTKLSFKDATYSELLAKTNGSLTGGSKQTINAVSLDDKNKLIALLNQNITAAIDAKTKSEFGSLDLALKGTTSISKNPIDMNREVGEQADSVDATQTATVSIFVLSSETKQQLINLIVGKDPSYQLVDPATAQFDLTFDSTSATDTQAQGTMTITGNALPKIDTFSLAQQLKLTTLSKAKTLIRRIVPRAYDVQINLHSYSPLKLIDLLPFNPDNIKIQVH